MRKTVQIGSELKKVYPNIRFSAEKISQFRDYFKILSQWNRKINLTAIRDPDQMITKHLLDSFAVYKTNKGACLASSNRASCMDIGSGAGLPGILLQIQNPDLHVYSIDKSKKKIGFQDYVKARLNLKDLEPISERIESLINSRYLEHSLDFIVSRAFVQIKDLFDYSRFFLSPNGVLILWKGNEWQRELNCVPGALREEFRLLESCNYQFHGGEFGGTILVFNRCSSKAAP